MVIQNSQRKWDLQVNKNKQIPIFIGFGFVFFLLKLMKKLE